MLLINNFYIPKCDITVHYSIKSIAFRYKTEKCRYLRTHKVCYNQIIKKSKRIILQKGERNMAKEIFSAVFGGAYTWHVYDGSCRMRK